MDVPFNRDEQLRRLRQRQRRDTDPTNRPFRDPRRTGLVGWIENIINTIERTIVALSNLAILIYQLVKYAIVTMLILFIFVLAYYGFKYVLLAIIWIQNQL